MPNFKGEVGASGGVCLQNMGTKAGFNPVIVQDQIKITITLQPLASAKKPLEATADTDQQE
jgi:hypothetical protein